MNLITQALSWADSHGLLTPAILAALTLLARALWAAVRPTLAARWPRATEAAEAVGERVAAVLPDVLRALVPPRPQPSRETAPSGRSGEAGRATVATLVLLALVGALGLGACPRWDRPRCETPGIYSCVDDQPHYCAPSRELTPIGDEPCARQGRVCALASDGVASCAAVSR